MEAEEGTFLSQKVRGTLVIIGGNEDKEHECTILRRVVALAGEEKARMIIMTIASRHQADTGRLYQAAFSRLGMTRVEVVSIRDRAETRSADLARRLADAGGIFFTGGDQLRITSILGGSELAYGLERAYRAGTVIAGTSAGASVMSRTMIVGGEEAGAPRNDAARMAPGLGLIDEVVVDQHFAQRGRIGRLLSAIAQNPRMLGLGIDEDTAVVVSPRAQLEVVGSGCVTIVDAAGMVDSNVSETSLGQPLALFGVQLHLLPAGYRFDLSTRQLLGQAKENAG